MWLSPKIFSILEVSKDTVDNLRSDLASCRAECTLLKQQLNVSETNGNWMRVKINQLEMERAGLINKAFNIQLPGVPELVRTTTLPKQTDPNIFAGFDDIGDDIAKALGGFPIYDHQN